MTPLWMKSGATKKRVGLVPIGPPGARFHSAGSIFNRRLADNAPLTSDQSLAVKYANQCQYTTTSSPVQGYYPSPYNVIINISSYSIPVYTMPANYPTTRVQWLTNSTNGPPATSGQTAGLQSLLEAVPVPQGITQLEANGTDKALVIYQPATDTVWEFWLWKKNYGSAGQGGPYPYVCGYAGVVQGISNNNGIVPNNWGLRSTSLSAIGGLMMMQEKIDGGFPHALVMSSGVATGTYIAPATRGDGAGAVSNAASPPGDMRDAVPHGLFLRLPASYTPPSTMNATLKMIVAAVRDYGMYIVDASGVPAFYAEDNRTVGTAFQSVTANPWGSQVNTLVGFPWSQLQRVAYTAPS